MEVFEGIGKYKGSRVKIQAKVGVRLVVQSPTRIPQHYQEPLEERIEELLEAGVTEVLMQHEVPRYPPRKPRVSRRLWHSSIITQREGRFGG